MGNRYTDHMARRVRSLQKGAFDTLIRGGVYNEEEARAILPYLEVRCVGEGYCIAIVRNCHPEPHSNQPLEEEVLRVYVSRYGFVHRRNCEDTVVFWNGHADHGIEELDRRLRSASLELESRCKLRVRYGISDWKTILTKAPESLREAERRIGSARSATGILSIREPARTVQAYILRNYHCPELTLNEIARQLELTETYVSQAFRKQTGTTYTEFLEQIRVQAACKLLQDRSLRISEIAVKAGYQTESTFFRAFRRTHGESPSAYRNRLKAAPRYAVEPAL